MFVTKELGVFDFPIVIVEQSYNYDLIIIKKRLPVYNKIPRISRFFYRLSRNVLYFLRINKLTMSDVSFVKIKNGKQIHSSPASS